MKKILLFVIIGVTQICHGQTQRPTSINGISGVINDYTEVTGFDICKNELTVADATKYNPGDTVLIIQIKGAVIDSTNTPSFGNIITYNNSGNYEMNIVKQKNGNALSLLNVLQRQYDIPMARYNW